MRIVKKFRVWPAILEFNISDPDGDVQFKKHKMSLSLASVIDKMYHTKKHVEIDLPFFTKL